MWNRNACSFLFLLINKLNNWGDDWLKKLKKYLALLFVSLSIVGIGTFFVATDSYLPIVHRQYNDEETIYSEIEYTEAEILISKPSNRHTVEGVVMEVIEIEDRYITIKITNNLPFYVITGAPYGLAFYDGGIWRSAPDNVSPDGSRFFHLMAYPISPRQSRNFTKSIGRYLPMEIGFYSIAKHIEITPYSFDAFTLNEYGASTPWIPIDDNCINCDKYKHLIGGHFISTVFLLNLHN